MLFKSITENILHLISGVVIYCFISCVCLFSGIEIYSHYALSGALLMVNFYARIDKTPAPKYVYPISAILPIIIFAIHFCYER